MSAGTWYVSERFFTYKNKKIKKYLHQNQEHDAVIAARCMHFSCFSSSFFRCRRPQPSPANTVFRSDCDGKLSENGFFSGLPRHHQPGEGRLIELRSALVAPLGQCTAATRCADFWFLGYIYITEDHSK